MKLLSRTSRYYLLWSSIAFLLAGIAFYFILRSLIHDSIDETLLSEKTNVIKELKQNPTHYSYFHNLEVKAIQTSLLPSNVIWSDTLIYNEGEKEFIPYRQLVQVVQIHGKAYQIVMRESLIESDDLIKAVFISLLLLLTVLVSGLFWINRFVTLKVWKPFWDTLSRLQTFQPGQNELLFLPDTTIDEFMALNQAVGELTRKVQRDYRSLKEFTENASHETQTPLSIIRSEIELLLQSEAWSDTQLRPLQTINEQVNRLTRLHASLLLLAKIENGQFPAQEPVLLSALVAKRLQEWNAMLDFKEIVTEFSLLADFEVSIHPLLADILIGNLLGNAVKHNIAQGKIRIESTLTKLTIANTGHQFEGDPEQFFERFQKQRSTSDSTGLGLAIVKKICQVHHFILSYKIEDNWHILTISLC
ncbi:sensor histidine kinase [Xanthocytophaga flava]|uniref:sensor histidine kinase n=1 Tax=Xanthocytophaga flava TaxID=3048013 RepID=UPI0028D4EE22|nr:HAMP domain-containing sensor histidine kinase [Xanthocytophaga flavus]MDJ1470314.1 HAMP domain-containing sensor histidine kinase [Xanthocytophaga flavus]